MRFDGDIVITDPCYIYKESWDDDEVDITNGKGFEKYFGETYIYEPTIYGDWSCTTYDIGSLDPIDVISDEKVENAKKIGRFCADAGLVCVVYLSKTSDEFKKKSDHIRTIIKDFHGEVEYVVRNKQAHIIGRSDDGQHNFLTIQTGL